MIHGFELVTRRVELVTRGFELEARVLLFHYNLIISVFLLTVDVFISIELFDVSLTVHGQVDVKYYKKLPFYLSFMF